MPRIIPITAVILVATTSLTYAEYRVMAKNVVAEAQRMEQAKIQKIYDRKRPDYTAQGRQVGAFQVDANVKATTKFEDNIFRTDGNEESDTIFTIRPEAALTSTWSRHQLGVSAFVEENQYLDNDDENHTNYGVNAKARLDVTETGFATFKAGYAVEHEGRDDPNSNRAAVEPTEYEVTTVSAGYSHFGPRIGLQGQVNYQELDFENGQTTTGATINYDARDREQVDYVAKVSYATGPDAKAFVRGTYTEVSYDQSAMRDSDGYEVVIGMAGHLTSTIKGEAYIGQLNRSYDNVAFSDIETLTYGGEVVWNPTRLTSVHGGVTRHIKETTAANASGVLQTKVGAGIQHELRRNVLVGADLDFITNEFEGNGREDDIITTGVHTKYYLNPNLAVKAAYEFQQRDSNTPANDYDNNLFLLSLMGAL